MAKARRQTEAMRRTFMQCCGFFLGACFCQITLAKFMSIQCHAPRLPPSNVRPTNLVISFHPSNLFPPIKTISLEVISFKITSIQLSSIVASIKFCVLRGGHSIGVSLDRLAVFLCARTRLRPASLCLAGVNVFAWVAWPGFARRYHECGIYLSVYTPARIFLSFCLSFFLSLRKSKLTWKESGRAEKN